MRDVYVAFFIGFITAIIIILLLYLFGLINVSGANTYNSIFCSNCVCRPPTS